MADDAYLESVISLVKERLTFLQDFWEHASFFFEQPKEYDLNAVKPKWNDDKTAFFREYIDALQSLENSAPVLEAAFKDLAQSRNIKVGELMLPLRVMLVGGKFGPGVFDIAALLGKDESISRVQKALSAFTA